MHGQTTLKFSFNVSLFFSDFKQNWVFTAHFRKIRRLQIERQSYQWGPSCFMYCCGLYPVLNRVAAFENYWSLSLSSGILRNVIYHIHSITSQKTVIFISITMITSNFMYIYIYIYMCVCVCVCVCINLTFSSINLTIGGSPNDHLPLCATSLSISSLLTYTVRRIKYVNIIIIIIIN